MRETSELDRSYLGSQRAKRTFTVQQANKTLPLVARIVRDVVAAFGEMRRTHNLLAQESGVSGFREQLEAQALDQQTALERYVAELSEVGCDLKDAEVGLVDFLGRHDGRDVCLCWRLGEDQIRFWHEVHTGFAGRREIATIREP